METEHETRDGKREVAKAKRFNKRIRALRMQVRGSLYKKELLGGTVHQHEYGEETYDEDEDEYTKVCKTCDHVLKFEKM